MRIAGLFSGAGQLEVSAMHLFPDSELVWHSEIEPSACAVLKHHFPGVPNLGDITQIDWADVAEEYGPIDILTGGFPCFPAGTPVLTGRGFVPIESVAVGDLVLTHRNRWRRVTDTMSRRSAVVEFEPGFYATPDHRFWVREPYRLWNNEIRQYRRHLTDPEFIPATELGGKFVARPISAPPLLEPELPAGMDWWQVGRWLADGHIDHAGSPVISIGYQKLGTDVARFEGWSLTRQKTAARVRLPKAAEAGKWLHSNFGYLAYGKTLPAWALSIPLEARREILEGYWSGDGYNFENGKRSTSVSPCLTVGVRALAESIGYTTALFFNRVAPTRVIEGRTVNQRDYWSVTATPDDGRFTECDESWRWSKLRKAPKPIDGEVEVFDLTVEEDHSFVAAGCVVHNCQDVSAAGKRAGLAEGTRSGLWSHMCAAIDALRPQYVLIENVKGLLSAKAIRHMESGSDDLGVDDGGHILRAIGAVLGDLSGIGFDADWTSVRASDVGAAHRRERVFLLAYPADADNARRQRGDQSSGANATRPGEDGWGRLVAGQRDSHAADAEGIGRQRLDDGPFGPTACDGRQRVAAGGLGRGDGVGTLLPTPQVADVTGGHKTRSGARRNELLLPGVAEAYTAGALLPTPRTIDMNGIGLHGDGGADLRTTAVNLLPTPAAADCTGGGAHPDTREGHSRQLIDYALLHGSPRWGVYEAAIRRQEAVMGRSAPSPTELNTKGNPRLSARFAEWLMAWPEGWVTDPAIGLSRNAQLKIIGNGIVLPQCVAAFSYLLSLETD